MTDALGNPLRWLLTPGQRHDVTQAGALLNGLTTEAVVADGGYDADWLIERITAAGAEVVIPPEVNRTTQRAYDANSYADRNGRTVRGRTVRGPIERLFGRLRRIAE